MRIAAYKKKGIHLMLFHADSKRLMSPRRYSTTVMATNPSVRPSRPFHALLTKGSSTAKHDGARQPDFKRMEIISVDGQLPTENKVVKEREGKGRGDTVVGEHVRHHGDLVMQWSATPNKFPELWVDRTFVEPLVKRIEDELRASYRRTPISILTLSFFYLAYHTHTSATD